MMLCSCFFTFFCNASYLTFQLIELTNMLKIRTIWKFLPIFLRKMLKLNITTGFTKATELRLKHLNSLAAQSKLPNFFSDLIELVVYSNAVVLCVDKNIIHLYFHMTVSYYQSCFFWTITIILALRC